MQNNNAPDPESALHAKAMVVEKLPSVPSANKRFTGGIVDASRLATSGGGAEGKASPASACELQKILGLCSSLIDVILSFGGFAWGKCESACRGAPAWMMLRASSDGSPKALGALTQYV